MDQLQKLRRAAGFTRLRLARQSQVSEYRLALAEGGLLDLTPEELAALSRALSAPLAETAEVIEGFLKTVSVAT